MVCKDTSNGYYGQVKRDSFFSETVKRAAFRIVSTDGHIDWVITNSSDFNLWTDDVKESNTVRWQVEEFHRAYKQLTGSEKCQCRAAR